MSDPPIFVFIGLAAVYVLVEFAIVPIQRRRLTDHLRAFIAHPLCLVALAGGPTRWQPLVALGIGHGILGWIMDSVPETIGGRSDPKQRLVWRLSLFAGRHGLQLGLALLFVLVFQAGSPMAESFRWQLFSPGSTVGLVWLAGLVLAVCTGARVIEILVEPIIESKDGPYGEQDRVILPRGFPDTSRMIGHWERAIIYLLVITGNISGVAFLAAAKSIFRVGDLTDSEHRRQAEFILIGTLMSFTWALFVAVSVKQLIDLITLAIETH